LWQAAFCEEDHEEWARHAVRTQGRRLEDASVCLEMIPHTALLVGDLNALIHVYESLAKEGSATTHLTPLWIL